MGTEESKPSFPTCATLNFQPSIELNHSSVANFENILLLIRSLSSVVPLLQMNSLVTIPAELLAAKLAGDKILLFVGIFYRPKIFFNFLFRFFLANGWALTKLFLDAKISSAKVESAISLLKAEILAIENRRNRMLDNNISVDDRKYEVVPALHSCEKILELFSDQSHCFWSLPISSSEYFLSVRYQHLSNRICNRTSVLFQFATLYLECLCHALFLMPSYREDAKRALVKIRNVLKTYQTKCVEERLKQTYCHVNPGGPRPESDTEIVELIAKMKYHKPISNNPNYRTSFGDKWPSVSTSSGLISWDQHVVGFRLREDKLIDAMECFLHYRRATRELYASKFDEDINLCSQMCTQLS